MIDSLSYLFRLIPEDINKVQMLYGVLADLQELAEQFQCAVNIWVFFFYANSNEKLFSLQILITNELTTRIIDDNNTELIPALGESHPHRTNFQISLARDCNDLQMFHASIDKHFFMENVQVSFRVISNKFLLFPSIR